MVSRLPRGDDERLIPTHAGATIQPAHRVAWRSPRIFSGRTPIKFHAVVTYRSAERRSRGGGDGDGGDGGMDGAASNTREYFLVDVMGWQDGALLFVAKAKERA